MYFSLNMIKNIDNNKIFKSMENYKKYYYV